MAHVRTFRDAAAVAAAAADHFERVAQEAVHARGRFTVALSGGSTPRALYERLAERADLPWRHIELCFGDERAVPPDDPANNAHMVHTALTHRPFVPAERVHRIRTELGAAAAARDYECVLRELFPDVALPRFDCILLGLGSDGHTASLFPHSKALDERDAWVVANTAPVAPRERITLTFPVLNAAAEVLFLVTGADKQTALREVLSGSAPVSSVPARGVAPESGDLCFFVDDAAARVSDPPTR
jgi:6-phosphogluconolactonase